MTVIEYAFCREAQKIKRNPDYRPEGWQHLLEIAEEILKRDADRTRETHKSQKAGK